MSLQPQLSELTPDKFVLQPAEREELQSAYAVIIGRILSQLPAFKWMKKILPRHIDHPYSEQMAEKSKVFALPLQFKNESKYEDCVDILDEYYEQIKQLYLEAYGNFSFDF